MYLGSYATLCKTMTSRAKNESTETWMKQKRRVHISEVAEEVQHRPWHDPQSSRPSNNDASTYACLCASSTLRLLLRTVLLHNQQTVMLFGGLVHVPIRLCVIVSLRAWQGHSSGTFRLSIKYPHVVDFGLLLKDLGFVGIFMLHISSL